MSKLETPMTVAYWGTVGGMLIEEFLLVPRKEGQGQRLADAVIIPGEPTVRQPPAARKVDVRGKNVIVVQTKASRLGMYLLGQALFSAEILRQHHGAAKVRSVALCTSSDATLEPMAKRFGIEVVVYDPIWAERPST